MKKHLRMIIGILLGVIITVESIVPVTAANKIVTTPTRYTSASDVEYKYHGKYISNWGARGEDCTFFSPNAQKYYVKNYTYDVLSDNQGGTSQSNAPSSALYKALQTMMKAEHSYIISYDATKELYRYTDCLLNDTEHISSFYSGRELNGAWDSAATWNREHTWPKSKGLNKNDKNNDNGDIMMLRPTWVSENSSRGNTAYGEGSSYFDPGESVRGDCARIVLYVYVRWGNTSRMWGTSGVIENLDILLKWMEEDPVDTWEMGRNDAVESITGVRNVFVDYPEYAWMLFGEEIPNHMSTPSGIAKGGSGNNNNNDNNDSNNDNNNNNDTSKPGCKHTNLRTVNKKDATCTQPGYTGDQYCVDCDTKIKSGSALEATGHKSTKLQGVKDVTCTEDGYDGDLVCTTCGDVVQAGQVITAPGSHSFGDWKVITEATETEDGAKERSCSNCEYTERETIPATKTEDVTDSETEGNQTQDEKEPTNPWIVGTAIVVPSGCVIGAVVAVLLKRRNHR